MEKQSNTHQDINIIIPIVFLLFFVLVLILLVKKALQGIKYIINGIKRFCEKFRQRRLRTTKTTDPRHRINFLLNRDYRMELSHILNNSIITIHPRDPRHSINYLLNDETN
ncbi:hypothetical protein RclHR1_12190004 [Rhizophagus clarus]|uniref:Uncharacterized protein n=1 Tax=Rhizophagus clarus TaxID=94130 RepID=A0A2Z6Q6G9_9GLOM|nr:hypothetical protein RclHR1_12190004 [Rhizophagus clarus]